MADDKEPLLTVKDCDEKRVEAYEQGWNDHVGLVMMRFHMAVKKAFPVVRTWWDRFWNR